MTRTHEQERELIDKYRDAAEKVAKRLIVSVSVNRFGGVQIVERGAYVECYIWVPEDEL